MRSKVLLVAALTAASGLRLAAASASTVPGPTTTPSALTFSPKAADVCTAAITSARIECTVSDMAGAVLTPNDLAKFAGQINHPSTQGIKTSVTYATASLTAQKLRANTISQLTQLSSPSAHWLTSENDGCRMIASSMRVAVMEQVPAAHENLAAPTTQITSAAKAQAAGGQNK